MKIKFIFCTFEKECSLFKSDYRHFFVLWKFAQTKTIEKLIVTIKLFFTRFFQSINQRRELIHTQALEFKIKLRC